MYIICGPTSVQADEPVLCLVYNMGDNPPYDNTRDRYDGKNPDPISPFSEALYI